MARDDIDKTDKIDKMLIDGLRAIGFDADKINSLAEKFVRYINEIELFNRAYNLVNVRSRAEIISAHILDSLSGAAIIAQLAAKPFGATIADIGSGAGLPGIPLAIALPQHDFVLVERMEKRSAFLENCVAVLSLQNVRVLHSELENVPSEQFDIATFRAFRPLDAHFATELLRVIKTEGVLAAYKARRDAIEAEMSAITSIVPHYEVHELQVPFLESHERNLVVVCK